MVDRRHSFSSDSCCVVPHSAARFIDNSERNVQLTSSHEDVAVLRVQVPGPEVCDCVAMLLTEWLGAFCVGHHKLLRRLRWTLRLHSRTVTGSCVRRQHQELSHSYHESWSIFVRHSQSGGEHTICERSHPSGRGRDMDTTLTDPSSCGSFNGTSVAATQVFRSTMMSFTVLPTKCHRCHTCFVSTPSVSGPGSELARKHIHGCVFDQG